MWADPTAEGLSVHAEGEPIACFLEPAEFVLVARIAAQLDNLQWGLGRREHFFCSVM